MKTIKFIFKWTKESMHTILFVAILMISLNYIRSLVPLLNAKVFGILQKNSASSLPEFLNNLFNDKDIPGQLITVALLIVVVVFIRDILNFVLDTAIADASETTGIRLQAAFYNQVQNLPYSYLNRAETGDLIQRSINDVNRFKRFIGGVLPNMLNSLAIIIIFTVQMFMIDVTYTLYAMIFVPVLFIVSLVYFSKIRSKFTELEEYEGKFTTVVQENLTGIRVVKAFANEKYEIDKFNNVMNKYLKSWRDINVRFSFYWGFTDVLTFAEILFAFVLAVVYTVKGTITLEQATAMFLLLQNILWPVRSLGRQISEMTKASIATNRIDEILQMKTEYLEQDGHLKPILRGNITFENVSFKFEDASIPTLKDVNFSIKEGETIAIVGRTGSGKTTLISLLNRMLETTEGKITIDGVDIKDIDKKYLRSNIGMVLQEPFLYSKTVAENISIIDKSLSMELIKNVALIASINDDIEGFEKGYSTVVGERGVTLSGGQKQRIAIARILTKDKPILVFDDSLSAVDSETDAKIRHALKDRQNKATTIIITHRIVTAKDADRIFVISDGKISDIGTHDELIQRPGLYQNIFNIQTYFASDSK
jgi:ATP-binding cassette subfamily B protein